MQPGWLLLVNCSLVPSIQSPRLPGSSLSWDVPPRPHPPQKQQVVCNRSELLSHRHMNPWIQHLLAPPTPGWSAAESPTRIVLPPLLPVLVPCRVSRHTAATATWVGSLCTPRLHWATEPDSPCFSPWHTAPSAGSTGATSLSPALELTSAPKLAELEGDWSRRMTGHRMLCLGEKQEDMGV